MKHLEFRSDTMTLPTEEMRDAMRNAVVGDDVCDEDPTVHKLEEMAATQLGCEAALLVPSGTFGNQCAIGVHTQPGDEVIISETSHIVDHEVGAAAALCGVQLRTVAPGATPYPTRDQFVERLRTDDDIHHPRTGLMVVENSLPDGTVMPLEAMASVAKLAREHDVPIHLDGARLFNAAIALRCGASEITQHVNSLSFCLSKGLGAPVGSVLCGSAEFIHRARKRRKLMGGGMRQAGIIAAPGIVALTTGPDQLAIDHRHARLLGEKLSSIAGIELDLNSVVTNMVWCRVRPDSGRTNDELVEHLERCSIRTYPPMGGRVRFVTSSEVDTDALEQLTKAVRDFF